MGNAIKTVNGFKINEKPSFTSYEQLLKAYNKAENIEGAIAVLQGRIGIPGLQCGEGWNYQVSDWVRENYIPICKMYFQIIDELPKIQDKASRKLPEVAVDELIRRGFSYLDSYINKFHYDEPAEEMISFFAERPWLILQLSCEQCKELKKAFEILSMMSKSVSTAPLLYEKKLFPKLVEINRVNEIVECLLKARKEQNQVNLSVAVADFIKVPAGYLLSANCELRDKIRWLIKEIQSDIIIAKLSSSITAKSLEEVNLVRKYLQDAKFIFLNAIFGE